MARFWSAAIWEHTSPELHWLFRRGVPLRLLVQRPRHVSRELNRRFDAGGIHPQAEMFLRRDLSPAVAVERVFRAGAALPRRHGDLPERRHTVDRPQYLPRAICWAVPSASSPSGPSWPYLPARRSSWCFAPTDRAAASRSRSRPWATCGPARKQTAVADYLKQLEARIAMSPADAVAHLVWPCYQSSPTPQRQIRNRKKLTSRK